MQLFGAKLVSEDRKVSPFSLFYRPAVKSESEIVFQRIIPEFLILGCTRWYYHSVKNIYIWKCKLRLSFTYKLQHTTICYTVLIAGNNFTFILTCTSYWQRRTIKKKNYNFLLQYLGFLNCFIFVIYLLLILFIWKISTIDSNWLKFADLFLVKFIQIH